MRIDVSRLLKEPVGSRLEVELDRGFWRLGDDLSVRAVRGQLELIRTDRGVLVQGTLAVDIDAECARCLAEVVETIEVEVEERFGTPPIRTAERGIVSPIDADHHLDLRPVLRELVIVSTPMHVLCRPDCRGLCPVCGKDLNEGPCNCRLEDVDPRLAVLKTLR